MGIILDTSVLIKADRLGLSVTDVLAETRSRFGSQPIEISVVTIAELTHGVFRAENAGRSRKRRLFLEVIKSLMTIHDFTPQIAEKVGQIEGEQAARGIAIGFEDLVIGTTALLLNFSVLTANVKHFKLIPDLDVLSL